MLRSLFLLFEGGRLLYLLTKKFRGKKVPLNYSDLLLLLITNWDLISPILKRNPILYKIFNALRTKRN